MALQALVLRRVIGFAGGYAGEAMTAQTECLVAELRMVGIFRNPGRTRPGYGIEKSKHHKYKNDKDERVLQGSASSFLKRHVKIRHCHP